MSIPVLLGSVEQEIVVEAPIGRVWAAFAEPELRGRWFGLPGARDTRSHELDFRVGGSEVTRSVFVNMEREERLELASRFIVISPLSRITTAYHLVLNDVVKFAAVATVLFDPVDSATRVTYLEQQQFFEVVGDGSAERGERRGGTGFLLRRLKLAVERPDNST